MCQTSHRGAYPVCLACFDELPRLNAACRTCAAPLADQTRIQCGPCGVNPPAIDRVLTRYRYEHRLRYMMHQFKYQEGLYLTAFMAQLMQHARPIHYNTQCLIPVPMHPKKLQQRGFNQAMLLAKALGRQLNIEVNPNDCQKVINSARQAGLKARERAKNLRHAFRARPINLQHVTLIDDLITTGSTANELAKTLKHAGVKRVDLWCCAKVCLG